MKRHKFIVIIIVLFGLTSLTIYKKTQNNSEKIISYTVNLKTQNLKFFWKNSAGQIIKNHKNLRDWLNTTNQDLIFAMNGGMYKEDSSPLGLYIENGDTLAKINRVKKAYGNFYLQPNGIFYIIKNNKPFICKTEDYPGSDNVKYATQSGPLLVVDGQIHPDFKKNSENLNTRNGVGILPDGKLIFAISKEGINFYDFAFYFKKMGCKNALYLDGGVSRIYLPKENQEQLDGNFGVIIAEIKKKK